jgi:hypothetical protein
MEGKQNKIKSQLLYSQNVEGEERGEEEKEGHAVHTKGLRQKKKTPVCMKLERVSLTLPG